MPVAIIDDDPDAACITRMAVEDADQEAFLVDTDAELQAAPSERGIQLMFERIRDKASVVVCDHRLRLGGFAMFEGAEFVAHAINNDLPAILISQFIDQDYDVSIRYWRAHLPSVISRDNFRAQTFSQALELCQSELSGIYTPERRKHRVLVRVADIRTKGDQPVVDAIVPSWSTSTAVRFPLSIVPFDLRQNLKTGDRIIANVNVGADRAEDLFFSDIETPIAASDAFPDNF